MPILNLIDVSLSMLAQLDGSNVGAEGASNRKTAAINGILSFLEYLETNHRQEFVSVVSFEI